MTLLIKNYFTKSYGDLHCKLANVVYGLECNLCGLVYVDETKGKLHKSILFTSILINSVNASSYHLINIP